MEEIYLLIEEHPQLFTYLFVVINAMWGLFTFFNKQRHEKAMANISNDLKLDSDRRLKFFELKASQYESYVTSLDNFGKKHNVDLPTKILPITTQYFSDYLSAANSGNQEKVTEVVSNFGSQISKLMHEVSEDFFRIQKESNKLKLTATDEMVEAFDHLMHLIETSMNDSHEFMKGFTQMVLNRNFEASIQFQTKAKAQGEEIQHASKHLLNLMREELKKA